MANGAIIDGEVDGCILSRNVTIGKNAVVKNCIILNGSKAVSYTHLFLMMEKRLLNYQKQKNKLGLIFLSYQRRL